jgi:hypothetical protein
MKKTCRKNLVTLSLKKETNKPNITGSISATSHQSIKYLKSAVIKKNRTEWTCSELLFDFFWF